MLGLFIPTYKFLSIHCILLNNNKNVSLTLCARHFSALHILLMHLFFTQPLFYFYSDFTE